MTSLVPAKLFPAFNVKFLGDIFQEMKDHCNRDANIELQTVIGIFSLQGMLMKSANVD
jgi:hypothetical protein